MHNMLEIAQTPPLNDGDVPVPQEVLLPEQPTAQPPELAFAEAQTLPDGNPETIRQQVARRLAEVMASAVSPTQETAVGTHDHAGHQAQPPEPSPATLGRPPAFEDDIAIAARQVTMAHPRGWRGGVLHTTGTTTRQLINSVPAPERQLMHLIWPHLTGMQRRSLVLKNYFGLSLTEIAVTTTTTKDFVEQHLHQADKVVAAAKSILAEVLSTTVPEQLPQETTKKHEPLDKRIPIEVVARPTEEPAQEALTRTLFGTAYILPEVKALTVYWDGIQKVHDENGNELPFVGVGRITGFHFQDALVQIRDLNHNMTKIDRCVVLASLALQNADIKNRLFIAEDTVKTHLKRAFLQHNLTSRSGIIRSLFAAGKYELINPASQTPWSPDSTREKQVCVGIARGMNYKQISDSLHISEYTVKAYVRRVMHNNDFHTRDEIALATTVSSLDDVLINLHQSASA